MRPSTILAGLSLWFLVGLLIAVPAGKLLRKRGKAFIPLSSIGHGKWQRVDKLVNRARESGAL